MRGRDYFRTVFIASILMTIVFFFAGSAEAFLSTWEFSTKIDTTSIGGSPNTDFILTYSFDSNAPDLEQSSDGARYETVNSSAKIGNDVLTFSPSYIYVRNNWLGGMDSYETWIGSWENSPPYEAPAINGTLYGQQVVFVGIRLDNYDANMFSGDSFSLPLDTTFSSKVDHASVNVLMQGWQDGSASLFYEIDSSQPFTLRLLDGSPVPVPAAVWLLGSGLLGLFGIRRKIRK